ncbi:hypothetical protein HYV21_01915 [Candidatus Microgenomates bacterium]|nr:hypothetical protein [Candidatus Microgenomates bacterium]
MAIKRTLTTQDIEHIATRLGKVFVTKGEFKEFQKEVITRLNKLENNFAKSFDRLDEIVGNLIFLHCPKILLMS